jgi:hypothetical protein
MPWNWTRGRDLDPVRERTPVAPGLTSLAGEHALAEERRRIGGLPARRATLRAWATAVLTTVSTVMALAPD